MTEQQHAAPASVVQLLAELAAAKSRGYGKGLPSELDHTFELLAQHYAHSGPDERAAIRARLPLEASLLLLGFSDRFAILAERSDNPAHLQTAGMAHSIEDFRYDDRENVFRLALICHVTQKLREDADKLLRSIAALSSPKGAAQLEAFMTRKPELKSIGAMGIVEVRTDDGVDYRYR